MVKKVVIVLFLCTVCLAQPRPVVPRVLRLVDAPADASSSGIAGQVAYDSDYLYICVSANTWKRVTLSTWSTDYLLLESGDFLLLESGDKLYLEN